jgi:hypothetical protein
MTAALSRFLHVANGTSTTKLIDAAAIPGTRSIWADPLYEGPVPANLTDDELVALRAQHLADAVDSSFTQTAADLKRWRTVIETHDAYDELVLWYEHDLFDQLNLIQILTWVRRRVPPAKIVSLVCIGSFPGHPKFKGLGELTAGDLSSLVEARERVGERQFDLAERAWQAFREPTPDELSQLRRADTTALPYLAAALDRFLQEYPWTDDGLSRTERRLLELAGEGTIELANALPRMHEGEHAYYVTDASLVAMARDLARTSPPLLELAFPSAGNLEALEGSVTLTDAGRAVLACREDRIALCGIDCWLGGVHLRSGADVWRWDEQSQRIIKS